jgi:hypothetical protein
VYEFLTQVETLAKVSGWTSQDKALIIKAKVQGLALQFLNGREELNRDGCPYEVLKQALVERFSDKLPYQYYYARLEEAVQDKDESAEEFSDRCRKMWQRTIRKVHDEETQRIINEEVARRVHSRTQGHCGSAGAIPNSRYHGAGGTASCHNRECREAPTPDRRA